MGAGKSKTLKINRKKSGKYLDSISKIERVRQVSGIDIKINPQQTSDSPGEDDKVDTIKNEGIKLTYFNTTGRAEISRLILAYAGVRFTDERLTTQEFVAMKNQLPWGQLPVLSVEDVVLGQSIAQARYLANEYNLAGRNNLERAQADEIVDTITDLMNTHIPAIMACKDEESKHPLVMRLRESATEMFDRLAKRLAGRGGQYFAGNALSWADLFFFAFCEILENFLEKFELEDSLADLRQRVGELPNIESWVRNRPQ